MASGVAYDEMGAETSDDSSCAGGSSSDEDQATQNLIAEIQYMNGI
jgi:hypothetical protein